jgi:hypothetical protein
MVAFLILIRSPLKEETKARENTAIINIATIIIQIFSIFFAEVVEGDFLPNEVEVKCLAIEVCVKIND